MRQHARSLSLVLLALGALVAPRGAWAQPDTTSATGADTAQVGVPKAPGTAPARKKPGRFYFGGGINFTFGSQTRIGASPLVGYRLTKTLSVGAQLSYEYLRLDVGPRTRSFRSYGGSVFGRYHPVPRVYAHVEPALLSQDVESAPNVWTREKVPYLFIGGGAIQPIAPGLGAYVQVTIDLVHSKKSPYRRDQAFVSTGITVDI